MTRLALIAALLATSLACKGEASRNESMGPGIDLVFGGDNNASFQATVAGTPRTELASNITFSGEAQLDYAPPDSSSVRFSAYIDGAPVAETEVVYTQPWPQPWRLVVDPVLDCGIDEACTRTVEVFVQNMGVETGSLTAAPCSASPARRRSETRWSTT